MKTKGKIILTLVLAGVVFVLSIPLWADEDTSDFVLGLIMLIYLIAGVVYAVMLIIRNVKIIGERRKEKKNSLP